MSLMGFLKRRLDKDVKAIPNATHIEDLEFWVIDGEMSGLNPKRDELLSLAAIPMSSKNIDVSKCEYWLIQPSEKRVQCDSIQVHGLTPKVSSFGRSAKDVIADIRHQLEGQLLVGHMIQLDMSFLNQLFTHLGEEPIQIRATIDTAKLWQWAMRRREPHWDQAQGAQRLEQIAKDWSLPQWPAHHAVGDALTCGALFLKLLEEFQKAGYETLKELGSLK